MKKIIILISMLFALVALTACGGGTEIVEEKPIETKEIGTVYDSEGEFLESPEYEEILDIMEKTDAQFFYIEHSFDTGENVVYQTDMEKYNEIAKEIQDATESSKMISEGVTHFANLTDKNIQADSNTWFKKMGGTKDGISMICGGGEGRDISLYTYFRDNEIKLSSEGITPLKIGIMYYDTWDDGTLEYRFFFVSEGDITVESEKADPLNIFAEAGTTKTYTIKGWGDIETWTGTMAIDRIYVNYN